MRRMPITTVAMLMACTLYAREVPLADGDYVFQHRFAEQPQMASITLQATIKGGDITLVNHEDSAVFPTGVIEQGELYWHALSRQWIVVSSDEDKEATEVGGCSDGPSVIDLNAMVYWTC